MTLTLIFHNHPNANLAPSERDIEMAKAWSEVLNNNGITLVEFVCGRGLHREYFLSPADEFHPLSTFLTAIEERNGKSWLANLRLHFERVFW